MERELPGGIRTRTHWCRLGASASDGKRGNSQVKISIPSQQMMTVKIMAEREGQRHDEFVGVVVVPVSRIMAGPNHNVFTNIFSLFYDLIIVASARLLVPGRRCTTLARPSRGFHCCKTIRASPRRLLFGYVLACFACAHPTYAPFVFLLCEEWVQTAG